LPEADQQVFCKLSFLQLPRRLN